MNATRLFVGSVLGLAIGFERQWRQRAVGMQTSALVSTGSTLFALISSALGYHAHVVEHIANAMTSRPDVISTSWSAVTDE
jgi:uncharacterized membrane protein YhiD involved in acid resistance